MCVCAREDTAPVHQMQECEYTRCRFYSTRYPLPLPKQHTLGYSASLATIRCLVLVVTRYGGMGVGARSEVRPFTRSIGFPARPLPSSIGPHSVAVPQFASQGDRVDRDPR